MDRRGKTAARHRHIAVDGKACRGSASPVNGVEAALVVNAIDVDTKRVLATMATPGPGQEVPTARKLLRRQDICLDGALVSFDAVHRCRETLGLVRRRGGDWLVPVKGNTPTLRDEIMFSLDAAAAKPVTVCEKGHGRLDTRTVRVVTDPDTCDWLGRNHGCDGLRTIGHIVYITEARGKKPKREECAFICSRRMGARDLLAEARRHWGSRWRTTAWTSRWARTPAASAPAGVRPTSPSCAASPWTGSTRCGARTSRCPPPSPASSAASPWSPPWRTPQWRQWNHPHRANTAPPGAVRRRAASFPRPQPGQVIRNGRAMQTWPKPVQKPHPPILLGGAFPWAARRAIRYGDGWYPTGGGGNLEEHLPRFREMAREAGRDPQSLPVTIGGVPE